MDVPHTPLVPAPSRWLDAPPADPRQSVNLQGQVRSVREIGLQRTLSLLAQQRRERQDGTRYRLHGQLAPLSLLGRGAAAWSKLGDLIEQVPTGDGPAADFFRDFAYELLVPSRAEPVAGFADVYQLYYAPAGPALDVLAGTLSRDAWGGAQYPFTALQPLDLGGRVIQGLPVPLPVTEAVVRLVARQGCRRYAWPSDWAGSALAPAADAEAGFRAERVPAALDEVRRQLVTDFKPAGWGTLSDGAFAAVLVGALVPVLAAYDLPFSAAAVQANRAFVAEQLGLGELGCPLLDEPTGQAEVLGPRVRFDPAAAELEYLSWPVYAREQPLQLPDTTENRTRLSLLGYQHAAAHGQLVAPLRFRWSPFARVPLRALSPFIERVPRAGSTGEPAWAWRDPQTDEWVYRDLLDPGVRQEDRGVDFPFLNDAHYVYTRVAHHVGPDLTDFNAFRAFSSVLPTGRLRAPVLNTLF